MIKWIIVAGVGIFVLGIIVLIIVSARKKGKKNAKKLEENITKFKAENEDLDKQAKIDADKKKEEEAFANITLTDDLENEFEDVFAQPNFAQTEKPQQPEDFVLDKQSPKFDLDDQMFNEKPRTKRVHKKTRDEEFDEFLNEHAFSRKVLDDDILEELRNLSPRAKAIVLGNLFNRFED